jgi:glucose/arabinose dehydrogenase
MVVATLDEPIALLAQPGDDDHVWVAERGGRVSRLALGDGTTLEPAGDALLDLSSETTTDAERGLLGMAFDATGEELYLSFTDTEGNSQVVAYEVDGTTPVVDSRRTLFSVDQPYPNHNGGHLVVHDDELWLGLGDGGAADDPENRAQDPDTELGKMIRIDTETGDAEIVVSGVRNPWRYSFDVDGSLWVADVGQSQWEEISHLPADAIEGANLGWSGFEGSRRFLDEPDRTPADPTPPVFEYSHDDGNCSITGGIAYRGQAIPALQGAYLFADYCLGRIRAIALGPDGELANEYDLGIDVETPISFGTDAAGEPYVLSAAGNIVRLLPG